ncbi:hypothetical protein EC919_102441 [Pseudomonas graminis]|nr:hypothetical protein EC919_102441 [Pseudomonas graminis]
MECQIRPATSEDSAAFSRVVIAALRESNSQDYPPDVIAQVERSFTLGAVSVQLTECTVFVALLDENIVCTASLMKMSSEVFSLTLHIKVARL